LIESSSGTIGEEAAPWLVELAETTKRTVDAPAEMNPIANQGA
jgi:hypothetical protein